MFPGYAVFNQVLYHQLQQAGFPTAAYARHNFDRLGILKSDTAAGWKVGDAVQLSMRPETLSLKNDGEQCVNVLNVTLKQTTYLGEIADHIAAGKDGSELKFYELNPISEMRNGVACELKVRPQDVVVLPPGKEE